MTDRLDYEIVDVFTETAYAGNPLAVVSGADGLSTRQLQAIAGEFNLSETAFPLTPSAEEAARGVDYRLRIFTPTTELPFAGHPSVGTAWLLAARGRVRPGRVVQACGAGDLPLDVPAGGGPVTLTGGAPMLGEVADGPAVAAGVGLKPDDVADQPAQLAGTGVAFCHLHVVEDAVSRAAPVPSSGTESVPVYVVGWPRVDGAPVEAVRTNGPDGVAVLPQPVRARLFASAVGVTEDPATGSAALGLAVQVVACGLLPGEGTSRFDIVQGVEMGRPSLLHVEVDADGGRAVSARVSGRVVEVAAGTIRTPS